MFDGEELLDRFVALEKEALAVINPHNTQPDAFPRWLERSERFPYCVNTIGSIVPDNGDDAYGDEGRSYLCSVWTRLVFGHITSGMRGEIDQRLVATVPRFIDYFDRRRQLQSTAYPVAMRWLHENGIELAQATFHPAMPVPSGSEGIGYELHWRCSFIIPVEQHYLGD